MKLGTRTVMAMLAVLVLASANTALGKTPRPQRAHEILPTLKTGQWIQVESVIQKDSPALCTELRLLTGDFLDDDWSLRGRVEKLDVKARRFSIGPIPIQVANNALIVAPRGKFSDLLSIHNGMIVDVDGTYLKNGTFRAKEIEDESDELRGTPGIDHRILLVGKVEHVDAGRHRITVMGTDFLITEKTQLKSLIR